MKPKPAEHQKPTWTFKRKPGHTLTLTAPPRVTWWLDAPRDEFTRRAKAMSFLGHTSRREGE